MTKNKANKDIPATPDDWIMYWDDVNIWAEEGDIDAQYQIGLAYLGRIEVDHIDVDPSLAAYWFEKAATQGHTGAQMQIGLMHYNGYHYKKNKKTAKKWVEKSASNGDMDAHCMLGIVHINDAPPVEPSDYDSHIEWFTKTAMQGHAQSQKELAILYLRLDDSKSGFDWLLKSAHNENPDAQFGIALMYRNEDGLIPGTDLKEARFWLEKAAENLQVSAMKILIDCYLTGSKEWGYSKNSKKTMCWIEKICLVKGEEADSSLVFDIGQMYYFGNKQYGYKRDWDKAYYWMRWAAKLGHEDSKKYVHILSIARKQ